MSQSSVHSQSLSEPTTSHSPVLHVSVCYSLPPLLPLPLPVSLCPSGPRQTQSDVMTVMLICLYKGCPGRFWGPRNYPFCLLPPLPFMGDSLPPLISPFPPPRHPPLPLSFFPPFSVFSPSASSISSLTCLGTGICMPKPSRQSLGFSPPLQSVPKDCTIVTVALLGGPGLPWEPIHSRDTQDDF